MKQALTSYTCITLSLLLNIKRKLIHMVTEQNFHSYVYTKLSLYNVICSIEQNIQKACYNMLKRTVEKTHYWCQNVFTSLENHVILFTCLYNVEPSIQAMKCKTNKVVNIDIAMVCPSFSLMYLMQEALYRSPYYCSICVVNGSNIAKVTPHS